MIPEYISDDEIKSLIKTYRNRITVIDRYASFDYCYNYFQSFKDGKVADIASKENIEKSVLQLGFYLASWGMYRGSSALLRHSSHSLLPVVEFIANKTQPKHWIIDLFNNDEKVADSEEKIADLTYLYEGIKESIFIPLPKKDGNKNIQESTVTLVTKIMLGVFGNTPALDSFFIKGIEQNSYNVEEKIKSIWMELKKFSEDKKDILNNDSDKIITLSFKDGGLKFPYPNAKLIDMIFFERGKEMRKKEENR